MTDIKNKLEQRMKQLQLYEAENKELIKEAQEPLKRLMAIAESDTGQSVRIARFLLALYNGPSFPFDMTDLRGIDRALKNDCLSVLKMDMKACEREVHHYLEGGKARFQVLAEQFLDDE